MLSRLSLAPQQEPSVPEVQAFAAAWITRDVRLLPASVPRWLFLRWLSECGFLLHGSPQPNISRFEPRAPHDLSGDPFNKRTGVFASSDGLWAMMYALRDPVRVARMLNAALQVQAEGGWSPLHYFLSLAARGPLGLNGVELLTPGWVYVLPRDGFEPMPSYVWPGVGLVREPQWVSPGAVSPLWCVPVAPVDFPIPVYTHLPAQIDARSHADPWGFPWDIGEKGLSESKQ